MTNETTTPAVKLVRFKNVSTVALSIPELNLMVPAGGYSAPMSESTPTIDAYLAGHLFIKENLSVPEIPGTGPKAITQGSATTEVDTTGSARPLVSGPDQQAQTPAAQPQAPAKAPVVTANKPTAQVDYLPPKMSSNTERINNYDKQSGIVKAVEGTVVSIGADPSQLNQFGEIPSDEASRILKSASRGEFSQEMPVNQVVKDEAQKIIDRAAGVVSNPPTNYPLPEGVPEEIAPFFKQTGLQKKIFIFKSSNATILEQVKGFEKDPNVLSCIDQRLQELEPTKK